MNRTFALAIPAFAAAIALSACSDSDDGDRAGAASASSTPTSSQSSAPIDQQILQAAQNAENAFSCPAFGGGQVCEISAETTGRYLDEVLTLTGGEVKWSAVNTVAVEMKDAVELLAGDCAQASPSTAATDLMTRCLNAQAATERIHEEFTRAVYEVKRGG